MVHAASQELVSRFIGQTIVRAPVSEETRPMHTTILLGKGPSRAYPDVVL